ncbi:helix-turn-helix domain-containing protein [Belnapia sp. T6]|uniref:Helix-turn-helix domain-containing protein n=1 Tax=Belnapia mucosa TaxID=2804532 RepID=A0ABS1V4K1_9PROT|nr:helix-turn-helix domain-containing protein [Belnapia mucosa]MBL6456611.1 helix-turn-helix domain-containing protein [Belnapia mucosa]
MTAGVVKSAQRVLEVLEHFAQTHMPASVAEISRRFGWPQSSTSVLLSSLEQLGYLSHDAETRSYRPTVRVMLLGAWLHDEIFGEGSLVSAMDGLRRSTGLTVLVGMRQGVQIRLVLVLRGLRPDAVPLASGFIAPACASAIGHMLLLGESDTELGRILRRSNAAVPDPAQRLALPDFLAELRRARSQGWSMRPAFGLPGRAVVATALPRMAGQPDLALGLGAPTAHVAAELPSLVAALRQACLGLAERRPVLAAHSAAGRRPARRRS